MPRKTRPKRWGLFVEGTKTLTPHRRTELVELWHELVSKVSNLPTKLVDVHGFTKFQLVAMGGDSQSSPITSGDSQKIPLDAVIAITHQREPFDILVVAFDAHPANQRLQPTKHGKLASATAFRPCQVDEVAFVLHQFANSRILPDAFKLESASLLERYQQQPKAAPRGKGRPPRGLLDLLYMDPEFEALVTSDDAAVRAIFSFPKKPKNWPTLPPKMQRPKDILRDIVDSCRRYGPTHLRDTFDRHPHAWAREIVRKAPTTSRIWSHPIASRLGLLLG